MELDKEVDDNKEFIVDNNAQMMDDNVPFRCFMQCMQEEWFHEENDINENASVVMQAPDNNLFQDKKPSLANASRMMNQLIDLNPHFNLIKEITPYTMALKFLRCLWQKIVIVATSLITHIMIYHINKFLRNLSGVTVGNRINNEVQLREWSCSIQGIEHTHKKHGWHSMGSSTNPKHLIM